MKVELNATKVQNAKMERKQDEITLKVNEMTVRQACVLFLAGFYDKSCDKEK